MHFRLLLILFLSISTFASAQDSGFQGFLKQMNANPLYPDNQTLLEFNYGIAFIDHEAFSKKVFAQPYAAELKYGFAQYDKIKGFDSLLEYNSQFLILRDLNSHIFFGEMGEGIGIESWSFSLAIADGFGWKWEHDHKLLLTHSSIFSWNHVDVEWAPENINDRKIVSAFDEKTKFANEWIAGIHYQLYKSINIQMEYSNKLLDPDYKFLPFIGNRLIEYALISGPDYFLEYLIPEFGNKWPIISFAAKNAVSFLFYNMRDKNLNWPFKDGKSPMQIQQFKIGLKLII